MLCSELYDKAWKKEETGTSREGIKPPSFLLASNYANHCTKLGQLVLLGDSIFGPIQSIESVSEHEKCQSNGQKD